MVAARVTHRPEHCAADVAVAAGRVVYTQLLNHRGGIECDLTVTRIAADEYYLVTGTGFATNTIQTGDRIRVDGSSGTVTVLD